MKKSIQFSKGFGLVQIIAIVAVLVLGGVYFTQKGGTSDVAAPTITLVSPNGGETLVIGSSTPVSFTTTGEIKDGYKVVIWLDEGAAPLATIAATTTSYSLTIPESILIGGDAMAPLSPGSYKIRVALYDGEPCTGFCMPTDVKELASDSSDGAVVIATSSSYETRTQSSITVSYPKLGDNFKVGSEVLIKWDDSSGKDQDFYTITLISSSSPIMVGNKIPFFVSEIDSSMVHTWKIPSNVTIGKYQIQVYRNTARELVGRSAEFTITN